MYLVTIARLNERGIGNPVPLSRLAEEMQILPVSANQMVRKLEEAGQVAYTPYKGVELTPAGRRQAFQILRRRRLWETFLVEHLGYSSMEADVYACRIEHIFPERSAERLADFLGRPNHTPSGEPIPEAHSEHLPVAGIRLAHLGVGERGYVLQIQADEITRSFLASEGLFPGAHLTVLGVGASGVLLVHLAEAGRLHLSPEVVDCIQVKPPDLDPAKL
jgi:DtxR family Mn-dependent transcriptional regulator